MDASELSCLWKERRTEELGSSQYHGHPVVDATVRSVGITANLFVFPHRVAKVDWVFL